MWDTGDLQHWAHVLGIGRPTGHRPARRRRRACCRPSSGATSSTAKGETERPWSAGDNVQLATGQGDLQTNPLQMAIAYATLGNGGTVVTPHVGHARSTTPPGRVLQEFDPGAAAPRPRSTPTTARRSSKACTRRRRPAAAPPTASSAASRSPVAGKTGTAQRPPHADQSWYVVLAPYPNPRIVTVGDHRGRRLRRRIGRPRRAADPRSLLRQARDRRRRARNGGSPG